MTESYKELIAKEESKEVSRLPAMSDRYYFHFPRTDTCYQTVWSGYLQIQESKPLIDESKKDELRDILIDTCEQNFYIKYDNNHICLSLDLDTYYFYYEFEKHIKKVVRQIEEKNNTYIDFGEFFGTECKNKGNQYKYTIKKKEDKIVLKKKILNWDTFENKAT